MKTLLQIICFSSIGCLSAARAFLYFHLFKVGKGDSELRDRVSIGHLRPLRARLAFRAVEPLVERFQSIGTVITPEAIYRSPLLETVARH